MNNLPRFRTPQARAFMAFTLAMDPTMAKELRHFIRMGIKDIRPDYMLVRNPTTDRHDYMDDPSAWNGVLVLPSGNHMSVSLIRFKDGKWSIHS
jgi:hypothetical protein